MTAKRLWAGLISHAKLKMRESTVATGGPRSRPSTTNCRLGDTCLFVTSTEKLICGLQQGVKGREDEWVDTAHVVRSEVTGLCGFWDGSCDNGKCGAGIVIQAFVESLCWVPIYKKCGPVTGQNTLDAKLEGCGMLTENLRPWIDKSVR